MPKKLVKYKGPYKVRQALSVGIGDKVRLRTNGSAGTVLGISIYKTPDSENLTAMLFIRMDVTRDIVHAASECLDTVPGETYVVEAY